MCQYTDQEEFDDKVTWLPRKMGTSRMIIVFIIQTGRLRGTRGKVADGIFNKDAGTQA